MIRCLPIAGMTTTLISSRFGMRTHPITGKPTKHNGIDYPCAEGTPVFAVDSGKVVVSKMQFDGRGLGNYITILHTDGTYSLYAHLRTRQVSLGNIVKAGQQIGLSGSTGDSTGPHLHFGICRDYVANNVNLCSWIDPTDMLRQKEEKEVITLKKILFNGEPLEVEMSVYKETNYIKLRDLEKLNIGIKVGYNSAKKMPEIKTTK